MASIITEYRGKRIDNGEWVYGGLVTCPISNACWIYYPDPDMTDTEVVDLGLRRIEVHPESVGMYTGLKDTEGVKIFQKDIIRKVAGVYNSLDEGIPYVVKFGTHETTTDYYASTAYGWFVEFRETIDHCFSTDCILEGLKGEAKGVKVVGNITDNPNMIESK